MTRAQFLDWARGQELRYEFDGLQPVAMTGGTRNHSRIARNIYFALRTRLNGTGCEPLGADAGVATIGDAVRYPDALVTCTKGPGSDRVIPGVVVVFEVPGPSCGRTDRIDKLREYRAVPSIRRYLILEQGSVGMTVHARLSGDDDWTATALTEGDVLRMPEIGIEIPVIEFYVGTELSAPASDDGVRAIG